MRTAWRDGLVLLLAAAGAGMDAWSYFGLGHVFVANMTGNTVLLGFSAASGVWAKVASSAIALTSYVGGVFLGALLARPVRRAVNAHTAGESPWPKRLTGILALECLMVLSAMAVSLLKHPHEGGTAARGVIAVVACAVGLQSAAMNAIQLPGIVTTYITGTWTTLVAGVVQLVDGEQIGTQRTAWEQRLLLQGAVLLVYCGAALLNGLVDRLTGARFLGVMPAAVLLLVVAGGLFKLHHVS